MKCPQCGKEVPEGSKFCGACGTTMNAGSVPQSEASIGAGEAPNPAPDNSFNGSGSFGQPPVNNNTQQQAESAASKRGLIILGGIAVAAIIVIVVLFSLIFSGGKTAPIDALVDYYNDRSTDVKDYYTVQFGSIWGKFKYEEAKLIADLKGEDDWEDDFADDLEDEYDDLEDEYGDDWKIDYEVRNEKELKNSAIRDYQETWENRIESIEDTIEYLEYDDDYSKDDIDELTEFYEDWIDKLEDTEVTEGYTLKLRLTIEGDDDDDKQTAEVDVVKLDGKWVMNGQLF